MTITILKAILVIAIMALMVIILLGINHILSGNFDADNKDASLLRDDLEKDENVITDQNVFRPLVHPVCQSARNASGHSHHDRD